MGRTPSAKKWTTEELAVRVCKNGHRGTWRNVVRDGKPTPYYQCKTCVADAVGRHRANGGTTVLRHGSIQALENKIQKLEQELLEAKRKLEIAKQVEALMADF